MTATEHAVCISIGGVSVTVRTGDEGLAEMLRQRYGGYLVESGEADFSFDIDLLPRATAPGNPADDVAVFREGPVWRMTRGDFRAWWDPGMRRGRILQTANPYSLDSVLRIVHTLILAPQGGFLLHAAGVIRHGRAFLFSGVSGAGKTTISRLAPADATLLTDEISYVRRVDGQYIACGTPFAGELAQPGENVTAPLAVVYLLEQGPENRIDALDSPMHAARGLMGNILFFAHDAELVEAVFDSALDFASRVPVKRLTFLPDERVWELIR